ncbi:hypothetical protein ID866_9272 [Astraeus odoratus]|nr:hypothetical protein ID866_9272 [Astraeus odoratus]
MFAGLSTILTIALAVLATAVPSPADEKYEESSSCDTGIAMCCDEVQPVEDAQAIGSLLGILEIPIELLDGDIGLDCVPLDIIGLLNPINCNQQPLCCENNYAVSLDFLCIP